jgi:sugar phosphate isomerase/epimerase
MSDWPIGFSTGCFHKTNILDALPAVRDGGFSLIEICSFREHLDFHDGDHVRKTADLMHRLGIEANSFHAPFAEALDISAVSPPQRAAAVREVLCACDAAHELGSRYLVLHPGPETPGRAKAEEWHLRMASAACSLNEIARHCRFLNLTLLLENMLPHLMFGHTSDMLYLLGAVRETNVGTCLDTGHAFLSGDLRMVVHKLSGHLRMLHINDNLGDRDSHLSPGEGAIDWTSLLRQLREWRFQGPLILELAGCGSDGARTMETARSARSYLGEILTRLEGGNAGRSS